MLFLSSLFVPLPNVVTPSIKNVALTSQKHKYTDISDGQWSPGN